MVIAFTVACRWCRRLVLSCSAVLVVAGLLSPVGGPAVAQASACPTSSDGGRAASKVSDTDRATILQLHNQYRDEVGVPQLTWDGSLADAAQRWTDVTAPLGQLCHDPNPNDQGENLADSPSVAAGVLGWYSEKSEYDRNPGPVSSLTGNWQIWGHYSQMVWSSTQRVGCGQAASAQFAGNVVLNCRYSPPGNFEGQLPYPLR